MNPANLSREVKEKASALGFDLCGISRVIPPGDYCRFLEWIEQGFDASMTWLRRRAKERGDPVLLLPNARSIIVCGINYRSTHLKSTKIDSDRGWIAQYALGEDYHVIFKEKLEILADFLRSLQTPPSIGGEGEGACESLLDKREQKGVCKICVDTAPLLEKSYGAAAGLGWIGKNTLLINEKIGSMFFLGEILTDVEIDPDRPTPARCGSCNKCIEACPTQALRAPHMLDSNRCISYWTIEHRGEIPEKVAQGIGHHLFGCDICQEICPWNREKPLTRQAGFRARSNRVAPLLESFAAWDQQIHDQFTRNSALRRAKLEEFKRNIDVALENASHLVDK